MLTHYFLTKSVDPDQLFSECKTLNQFMRALQKRSQLDPTRYPTEKYLGDGFEFFIEVLLALHPCDSRIGLTDYKPNQENDNGVDGTALNLNGDLSVVQIKFRSEVQKTITANEDHLSNLITDGMMSFGVVADPANHKNFRHFIFTTSNGLHFYTDNEMFKNRVKCFGHKEISTLVDQNTHFWNKASDLVKMSLQERIKDVS